MNWWQIALVVLAIIFYTALFFQGRIVKSFNLVDKRTLIGNEETYKKLNTLMSVAEVSLYRHQFMDTPKTVISVSYSPSKTEDVSTRIFASDLNEAVEQAYAWATEKGLIN